MAVALTLPAIAHADFEDSIGTLPGSNCRKVGTSGVLAITPDGAIFNDVAAGNPALTVECPAASAAQGDKTFNGTSVTYLDHSPSSVICTLRAEDDDSTSFNTFTAGSTGNDNGYRTIDLTGVQGFAEGEMHLRCTIPARDSSGNASYIVGYVVDDDPINDPLNFPGYHTWPGTMCRQIATGSTGITSDGALYNASSTTAVAIDCPVMDTRHSGATTAQTKVWYLDSSPSVLSCTLAAEAPDSTAVSQITLNSTVDDNNYHSFNFSGSHAITTFETGFVHVRCSIPPIDSGGTASYLVGYALHVGV